MTPVSRYNFNFAIEEEDWTAAKLLIDDLDRELADRRRNVVMRLAAWHLAVRVFRRVEQRRMVLQEPRPRDLSYHLSLLVFLRGSGELLRLELEQRGALRPEFAATIENLRLTEVEWHGNLSGTRRDQVLKDVFARPTPPPRPDH